MSPRSARGPGTVWGGREQPLSSLGMEAAEGDGKGGVLLRTSLLWRKVKKGPLLPPTLPAASFRKAVSGKLLKLKKKDENRPGGKLGLDQQGPRPDPPHAVSARICVPVPLQSPAPACLLPSQERGSCSSIRLRAINLLEMTGPWCRTTVKVLKYLHCLPAPSFRFCESGLKNLRAVREEQGC